jgi:hypothetical protein
MQPLDIVRAARGWLGTRFHHQGRIKKNDSHKGGVDCLGLLVGVAAELDLKLADGRSLTSFDEQDYSHLPDTDYLSKKLALVLRPIDPRHINHADILLLRVDDSPQHLAIASDYSLGFGIIHAYAPARAVVEHALDHYWFLRIAAAYRLPLFT